MLKEKYPRVNLQKTDPIIALYGDNALHEVMQEVVELSNNCNISFDSKYISTAIHILVIEAWQVLNLGKNLLYLS